MDGARFLITVVSANEELRKQYLQKLGHQDFLVNTARRTDEAYYMITVELSDLVVIDLAEFGADGGILIEELRRNSETKNIPILTIDGATESPADTLPRINKLLTGRLPRSRERQIEAERAIKSRRIIKLGIRPLTHAAGSENLSRERGEMAELASQIEELKSLVATTQKPHEVTLTESKKITEEDLRSLEERMKSETEVRFKEMRSQYEGQKTKLQEALAEKEHLLALGQEQREEEIERRMKMLKKELAKKEELWRDQIEQRETMLASVQTELKKIKSTEKKKKRRRRAKKVAVVGEATVKALETEIKQFKSDLTNIEHAKSEEEVLKEAIAAIPKRKRTKEKIVEAEKFFDKTYKFLIIEDDPIVARLYKKKLQLLDQKVVDANLGRQGIELIESEKPNLILLDMSLPDISGLDVLTFMKDTRANIPVVVLTNIEDEATVSQAKTFNIKNYLSKADTTPKQVMETLREALSPQK